jgi:type II secretory ATPase GspE/PulE/Tfp pilus assembly ATPase PilB-like protein
VLAQRLIRRVCKHCGAEKPVTDEIAELLTMHGLSAKTIRHGKGCDKCRKTGYSGRAGLYELLILDDHLRDQIARNPNVTEFRRMCTGRGMVTLREDGFKKVANGVTTVEEVLSVTEGTI